MSDSHRQTGVVPSVLHVVVSLAPGGLERLVVDWANARNGMHPGSTSICCLDESGALSDAVDGDCVRVLNARRGRFPFDVPAVWRLSRLMREKKRTASTGHRTLVSESTPNIQHPTPNIQGKNPLLGSWLLGVGRWMFNSVSPKTAPKRSAPLEARPNTERFPLVVHSHNLAAWQYAAIAARLAGVPHIHTEHGTNPHYRGPVNHVRNRLLSPATDAIVAVSFNTADALVTNQRIPRNRIHVISNGVDSGYSTTSAAFEIRSELGLCADLPVIGSIGRLAPVKGQDRLLRSFAALREMMDCRLLLVGDGPSRFELEALASELGLDRDVTFAGFMSNARDALSVMDLFVLPSRSEGLPVALLEAMAAGVPVAATPVGEVPDVLEHGKAGVILPDDETLWAQVLNKELCHDQDAVEQRSDRVRRARNRVVECYSQERTLAMYEVLYQQTERRSRR